MGPLLRCLSVLALLGACSADFAPGGADPEGEGEGEGEEGEGEGEGGAPVDTFDCEGRPGPPGREECVPGGGGGDGEGEGEGEGGVEGEGEGAEGEGEGGVPGEGEGEGEGGTPAEGEGEGGDEGEGEGPVCVPGAHAEVCNGIDDDCDGVVDEDPEGVAGHCFAGVGECERGGRVRCAGGEAVCDAVPAAPNPELCNGRDDDCDGEVDEDAVNVGQVCSAGRGGCRRPGVVVCEDGGARCAAAAGEPAQERCNGIDDDCDGDTDEQSLDAGGACTGGLGECARGGRLRCERGDLQCDAQAGEALAERCNGLDDDCDGETDDAPADTGDPCVAGVGECRREAATRCVDGELVCGDGPGEPAEEQCDGLDNDCDGQVDEGADCEQCAPPCPIAELPAGALLCMALPPQDAADCPDGYGMDLGVQRTGDPVPRVECGECLCEAHMQPVVTEDRQCDERVDVGAGVTCDDGTCRLDGCQLFLMRHQTEITLTVTEAEPGGACDVENEASWRLCCTEALPRQEGCEQPVCPEPAGARGPLLVSEDAGVREGCLEQGLAAATLFEGVALVGASCDACACEATARSTACLGGAQATCDVAEHGESCRTECPNLRGGRWHAVEVSGTGAVPSGRGECEPVGPLSACDPEGRLF